MECAFCKETIIDGALICRFCGKDQPGSAPPPAQAKMPGFLKFVLWVGGAFIAFVVIGNLLPQRSPAERLDAGYAECDRQFGAGSPGAADCRLTLGVAAVRAVHQEKLDRAAAAAR